LKERHQPYVDSAIALGAGRTRIIGRHILPNVLGPAVILATSDFGKVILGLASLSFLGLGMQPPTPEWGVMISEGSPFIVSGQWWMSFFPGMALILMTAGFILVGDGLSARTER